MQTQLILIILGGRYSFCMKHDIYTMSTDIESLPVCYNDKILQTSKKILKIFLAHGILDVLRRPCSQHAKSPLATVSIFHHFSTME